ncbi:MAG TPA: precorrin-3B C(17)-methyltransferase [Dissulfurispiraceae bacterium]|nr:precorrin-3B C(17)-methyltransferase [Dissulfurispiraceae bacterium]
MTVFYITRAAKELATQICSRIEGSEAVRFSAPAVKRRWTTGTQLVFIMATGIVVRTIAPLLDNKKSDPAVVVIDDSGNHVISLVGGHLGGANALARILAAALDATPVITTASDVAGLPALDIWARSKGLIIENPEILPPVMTRLVNEHRLRVFSDIDLDMPPEFYCIPEYGQADVIISDRSFRTPPSPGQLILRPKDLVIGLGCNSGTPEEDIEAAIRSALKTGCFAFESILSVATIHRKAGEPGLVSFSARHNIPIVSFSANELNAVPNIGRSETVFKATGAHAVSHPAALLAAGAEWLLIEKLAFPNVTVAVARMVPKAQRIGSLSIIGIGPGVPAHMTAAARAALLNADLVVGYSSYVEQIRPLLATKEVIETGMTHEVERGMEAINCALQGRHVAVISGGDPGIYAMSGLIFELLKAKDPDKFDLRVRVIPGVSALNAAAALLGAPLMHDFSVVSLSDRLTPWAVIEKRLKAAASADFVIALYNPKSKGRPAQLKQAVEIIGRYRNDATPVGIVRAAMRANQHVDLVSLGTIPFDDVDMQTIVVIGNSKTFAWKGRMITPRGYGDKYELT